MVHLLTGLTVEFDGSVYNSFADCPLELTLPKSLVRTYKMTVEATQPAS